jgi:hypothetical protein
MNETQRFRGRVRSTLMSIRCQKIAISLDTLTITGTDYAYIALAMLERPDNVVGMSVRAENQGDASASMRPSNPAAGQPIAAFSIPIKPWFAGTYHEEMIIVHESTHASFEARTGLALRALTNEALAYLADAMYNNLGSPGDPVFDPVNGERPPPAKKLTQESRNVLIAANNLARLAIGRPNGTITRAEISVIENSVANHSIYADLKANPSLTDTSRGIRLARTSAIDPAVRHVLR